MATKAIEFKVPVQDFDADQWKKLVEARKQVALIEEEIIKTYKVSAPYKAVRDLTGYGEYNNKFMVTVSVSGDKIVARTIVDEVDATSDTKSNTRHGAPNIGEKTLNALLTGKLLNDAEKKALLKRYGVDIDEVKLGPKKPLFDDYVAPNLV